MDTTDKKRRRIKKGKRANKKRTKDGTFQDSVYVSPAERKTILQGASAIEPFISLSTMYTQGALEFARKRIAQAERASAR